MKFLVTRTAFRALSLALATTAFAAAGASTSPGASGRGATSMTQPSHSTTMASPTQKVQPSGGTSSSTASGTTQRGPATTGQPSQNCQTLGNQPGNAMSAPGSAFNPNGTAGGVYAGNQPQSSGNTASVSQYDVACARPH